MSIKMVNLTALEQDVLVLQLRLIHELVGYIISIYACFGLMHL